MSGNSAESDAGVSECSTCEGITPTGLRRKEMGGFVCPTCGHRTPEWGSVTPPVEGGTDG